MGERRARWVGDAGLYYDIAAGLSDDALQRVPDEKRPAEVDNGQDHEDEYEKDERRFDRSCPVLRAEEPAFSARGGANRHWVRSTVLAFTDGGKGQVPETNGV